MSSPDDALDGFLGDENDENPVPLNLRPYACRVAELLRGPGALDRWRSRCHEAYREKRQRQEALAAWNNRRVE